MGRAFGRPGGWQHADLPATDDLTSWLAGRLPEGLFEGPPEVTVDRDEVLIVGMIASPYGPGDPEEPLGEDGRAARAAAEAGRIARFREETRDQRIGVAEQAERRYRRKVSWGARCGGSQELFTTYSAPVMSRLRQPQRQVLDTLVGAGVARSRSEALGWCVRLVGEHADTWLAGLRQAMEQVDELRVRGPEL
ncbi:MAG: hypothetical protein HYR62_04330 [Actinobacteria bacterium]|nr:hypothetical protein [Actinomycetota bacterium]MBI3685864.1 hypothetical protein [Actinomycetota bacterium]